MKMEKRIRFFNAIGEIILTNAPLWERGRAGYLVQGILDYHENGIRFVGTQFQRSGWALREYDIRGIPYVFEGYPQAKKIWLHMEPDEEWEEEEEEEGE